MRLAAARCEELVVGITNPERDSSPSEPTDAARHRAEENPYSYWERLQMIDAVLEAEGLDGLIVPFPISEPERLCHYLPRGGTHYLRVFDEWGEEKVRRLRELGCDVVVLEPGASKLLTGSEVRASMQGGGAWHELVPPSVAGVLERLRDEADRRRSA